MQTIDVITYNIHKGFSPGRLKYMLPQMREALHELNTDLIFLQEVQGEHKRQEKRHKGQVDISQFEFIADSLWQHYAYAKNAIYQAGHHGNAILSKYPFIDWENINVATIQRASRSLLHGLIKIPNQEKQLHVICIHLGLFKAERVDQVETLFARIAEHVPENEPLFIAGDFNDWREESTAALEAELGLEEVFKVLNGDYAKSFPAWRPTLRTDRIYFRGLQLLEGECIKKMPWRVMSDHLPLLARFEF